jgi:hypothetical protein
MRPENHKEDQAGNSPEHAVEGQCRIGADGAVAVFCFVLFCGLSSALFYLG